MGPARLPGRSIEAVGHYKGLCTLHILWKAPLASHLPVPTSQLVLISLLQSPPKPFSHVSALQLPRALGCVRAGGRGTQGHMKLQGLFCFCGP